MHLADIRDYCLSLPAVTEDIKWENHLCFCVGGKMFLITSPDEVPVSASLKVSAEDFAELITVNGIKPASYLARYGWVQLDSIERFNDSQWKRYLKEAHRLIGEKLPKREQKRLGLVFSGE